MRRLCIALTVALGGAFVVPSDPAEARPRHHPVSKHHNVSKKSLSHYRKHLSYATSRTGRSVSLAGVTPVLATKARQIAASCGSVIISAVSRRPGRSNHPIGRAVDMRGNPRCMYAHLKGWPGGYSTDYAAAGHLHISYNPGGQEWGLRFAHGGSRKSRVTRLAYDRSRGSSAAHYSYSSSRKNAYRSSRKSRPTRQVQRGVAAYAMQPASSAPAKHSVH